MKNKIWLLLVAFSIMVGSCSKDFEEINTDIKNPATVPPGALFANAQKELVDNITSSNVNLNVFRMLSQYWTETTYIDEANYDFNTRNIPQNFWNGMYVNVLKNLKESKSLIPSQDRVLYPDAVQKNQAACTEILSVYAFAVLVNVYGDIPYSEALDIDKVTPKYDKALDIYDDLVKRLDAAMQIIDSNAGGFGSSDILYGGDMIGWKKMANSLKLRLGIMLADVDLAKSKAIVESAAAGAILDNSNNCVFQYLSAPPNTNPIWVDLVQSGRKDFIAANTIVDIMDSLGSDPRIPFYFTTDAAGGYSGGPYAYSNNYGTYSKPADRLLVPGFEALLFDAAETQFILAEAAERGMSVSGTAASHYEAGIRESMAYWRVSESDIDAFLLEPEVAYATAPGNWKQKIGTQKWIALYNRGIEGWTEWRRLDYPIVNLPEDLTYGDIPVRFTYPVQEQNLNTTKWKDAAAAIGGDDVTTKLFWDKF